MISWQAFNPYPPANFSRPQLAPALKFTPAFNACGGGSVEHDIISLLHCAHL